MPGPRASRKSDTPNVIPPVIGKSLSRALYLSALFCAAPLASAATVTAVEFYNESLDHYFVSALTPDIDALDSGRIRGWKRTGQTFQVFPSQDAGGASVHPVCRFYIPPQRGDSHFLSASATECATVLSLTATHPNYSGYVYESPNAFYIALPDLMTGNCPANTLPVFRLWNNRADSNHRYTADPAVKGEMLAKGYVAEGYGPNAVAMCAPADGLADVQARLTSTSPFAPGCDGVPPTGTLFTNAEVEPYIAVNPRNPNNLVGVWQQDRWSDGAAAGLRTGFSFDGGRTWGLTAATFSRCTGGNAANGGGYERATDPWVTFAPDGIAFQIALAISGESFTPGSANAILVSRSIDGGRTWSNPITLIRDGAEAFNDKESITADATDSRYVYAVWDRLPAAGGGPGYFSRTTDGGASWETARPIYDPGNNSQTINNQIVVLGNGTLVNFFTRLDFAGDNLVGSTLQLIRSTDKGVTWSIPVTIADVQALGVRDPVTGFAVRDGAYLGSIAASRNGVLAAVWQDARFSGGVRDGVAFSRSFDGGSTWSPPVRVNREPAVQAFIPAVTIRDDGVIGVTYFDFRSDTPSVATLLTDYWLAQSTDGVTWRESRVAGPFNYAIAPNARGLFLGDYMGLISIGTTFVPFYTTTNDGNLINRTDVFATLATSTGSAATAKAADHDALSSPMRAESAPPLAPTSELQKRLHDAVARTLERRVPGWTPRGIISDPDTRQR